MEKQKISVTTDVYGNSMITIGACDMFIHYIEGSWFGSIFEPVTSMWVEMTPKSAERIAALVLPYNGRFPLSH